MILSKYYKNKIKIRDQRQSH